MRSLLRLLRRYADAVEADLLRFYQVDLVDLYRPGPRLTWRRLGTLIRMLPADATVWRAAGVDHLSRSEHYLAGLWELWAEQSHPDRPGPPVDEGRQRTTQRGTPPDGDWSRKLLDHQKRYANAS
ncbi:hypothetical protein KIK06_23375 [Nocardiopsis sp. EMB25]|uniref:hypothetical protein n=1 Tax=Nocardiopsis sp. EMB25 TaxID=2835867 RepID=UPI0022852576|nr:hypothetical protein [Nocardiopsis sp. EMB25]MCY9786828.1 hypothetical protein [Nocardiopsis sp. EMB25]